MKLARGKKGVEGPSGERLNHLLRAQRRRGIPTGRPTASPREGKKKTPRPNLRAAAEGEKKLKGPCLRSRRVAEEKIRNGEIVTPKQRGEREKGPEFCPNEPTRESSMITGKGKKKRKTPTPTKEEKNR